MNFIVAIGASTTLFLSIYLLKQGTKILSNRILLTYSLITSLVYTSLYFFYDSKISYFGLAFGYSNQIIMPIFHRYLFALLYNKRSKTTLFLFIPLIVSFVITIAVIIFADSISVEKFFMFSLREGSINYYFVYILEILIVPIVLIIMLLDMEKYKQIVEKSFSNHKKMDFKWVKIIIIFEFASWAIILFASLTSDFLFPQYDLLIIQISIAITAVFTTTVVLFGISESPAVKKVMFNDGVLFTSKTYNKSSLDSNKAKIIESELNRLVNSELIQDPDLNLNHLSKLINVTPAWISETLNVYMNTTFYNYINKKRIELFSDKIKNGEADTKTLLALAYESGFNSKATFNRIFKEVKKITPSQYRKKVSENL